MFKEACRRPGGAWSALVVIPLAMLLMATLANGQSIEEMADDILHSDLPIFGFGGDNEWPQHIVDEDSFGCLSRVKFGDWAFQRSDDDFEFDELWYRFSNYGVFHCWINAFRAAERAALESVGAAPAFFAFLGNATVNGSVVELWVVQIGARPGSDYVLLARAPSDRLIEAFDVLQVDCPSANVRDAGPMDIVLTRYCAINSRKELIRFARRMAQRPPLGRLVMMPADGEAEVDAGE